VVGAVRPHRVELLGVKFTL